MITIITTFILTVLYNHPPNMAILTVPSIDVLLAAFEPLPTITGEPDYPQLKALRATIPGNASSIDIVWGNHTS